MIASNSLSTRYFRALRGALAVCLMGLALGSAAQAQLDQVSSLDRRGRTVTLRGRILSNTLTATVIESGGSETSIASDAVRAVRVGAVPTAFSDGQAYLERGDFENAAAQFQAVAGDGEERDVVRAEARLRAARAWLKLGSNDDRAFGEAQAQLERFVADHADHRDLPQARLLLGRAMWLAGDLSGAIETLTELKNEWNSGSPTTGYSAEICMRAGSLAADCMLASGDADGARALYAELAASITSALAELDADSDAHHRLQTIETEARLGEGFCLLASGSTTQAKTFFEGQLNSADPLDSRRFAAHLGLGRVYFAEARYRAAANEYAQVSAIDYSSRDRTAAALLGLAECAIKLSDADAGEQAARWLRTIQERYGDTPSAPRAKELVKGL